MTNAHQDSPMEASPGNMLRSLMSIAAAVVLVAEPASAQKVDEIPALATDRPGQGAPPGILTPGYVQIEAGFQYISDQETVEGETAGPVTLSLPTALVRIGVFKNAELRIGAEYRSFTLSAPPAADTTISGMASISVGTKVGITPEDGPIPETALLLTLSLPVGSDAFRPAAVAPSAILAMRTGLSSTASLYYNIGGAWDGTNGSGVGLYSLMLGNSFTDRLSGFAEIYGTLATGAMPAHAADAGIAYVVASNLQLDIYGGAAITDNAPNYFVNAGVSVRLPR